MDRVVAWGVELRQVHARLREALALARQSLEAGEPSDAAAKDLLIYCLGFCAALDGHHRGEDDTLLPHLAHERPDLVPVLDKLRQDHSMLTDLVRGLEQALRGDAGTEVSLRHLDGIEAVMESHFRYEERELLGVLDRLTGLDASREAALGPLAT